MAAPQGNHLAGLSVQLDHPLDIHPILWPTLLNSLSATRHCKIREKTLGKHQKKQYWKWNRQLLDKTDECSKNLREKFQLTRDPPTATMTSPRTMLPASPLLVGFRPALAAALVPGT
jgi:hypothetical protein